MPQRILVVQSRRAPEVIAAEQRQYKAAVGALAQLTFISSLNESLPWNEPYTIIAGYDGILIGGSGEFSLDEERVDDESRLTARAILSRISPLIAFVLETDTPTLGVCFGHQLIGEHQGGTVLSDKEQKKVGAHSVTLTDEGKADRLFAGMPDTFIGQYGHKNSLTQLPRGATLLAQGEHCRFSALRYGARVYTVQFHPELTADDVLERLQLSPGYLPEGVAVETLIKPSPEASALIGRFVTQLSFSPAAL